MDSSKIDPKIMTPEQAMALSSDNEKLEYFLKVRVKHLRVSSILTDLETIVLPESGTDIALLIGPTGVGKSISCKYLKERIIQLHKKKMEEDSSMIPVVLISAPASGEKSFSWRIFYTQLGHELNEPLMDRKQEDRLQDGRLSIRHISSGSTVAGLRMAIEDTLRYRHTVLVIIDEAVHLIRHSKGNSLAAQMDALKSLTIMDGVNLTLVLVGSYDLYKLMCLSGQLARRSTIIHFQRYLSGVPKDEIAFLKSLHFLQKYMPLSGIPDLSVFSGQLMRSCIGCVGTLKETLQRALTFALRNNGTWTDDCLKKALLSEKQICSVLKETLEGEKDIENAVFGSGSLNFPIQEQKRVA